MYRVESFLTIDGKDLFESWLRGLRDQRAQLAITQRLERAALGNFGDHKFCSEGVFELRIRFGPGFRIYYSLEDGRVVLLLAGGDKGSQSDDIRRAVARLDEWKERQDEK